MQNVILRTVGRILSGVLLTVGCVVATIAGDPQKMINSTLDGVAIKGYDTVAYFTENQSMQGKSNFAYSWRDVEWHFANASHRELFAADPERYAPQYGGFCANAMSKGKVAIADPEAWTIVDEKLYIKFNFVSRDKWRKNKARKIKKADKNWAELQKQE
jgi:YHS domain-containing protein